MKIRQIYASIAGLLQVNSTQLALKIAARDRFIIRISGYLPITINLAGKLSLSNLHALLHYTSCLVMIEFINACLGFVF